MINFRYVDIPRVILPLLKSNMTSTGPLFLKLPHYFKENAFLSYLAETKLSDLDDQGRPEKMVTSIGWLGLRNRLIRHFLEEKYPELEKLPMAEEWPLKFAMKADDYSLPGYSRGLLLGLYFYIDGLNQGLEYQMTDLVPPSIFELMDQMNGRKPEVDWLILILLHLNEFLGPQKLESLIQAGMGFNKIHSQLSFEDQETMARNLLKYGASIGEKDFFHSEVIL